MMSEKFTLNPKFPRKLLSACPAYTATPLVQRNVGAQSLWIKDETNRMGLGAFKALGGVYAVARLIEQQIGESLSPTDYTSERVRAQAAKITFVCASAGNHGMAVAAGARLFGANCRIHLSSTVPEGFASRLQNKGAAVVRSGTNYEESVQFAIADAENTGAIHLADGSWPGYTEPPRLVMEGYTILAEEMRESFEASGNWPSHIFLQAGVGGLAAAIAYMIRKNWATQPQIIIVEPDAAPCLKESISTGEIVTVKGPISNMGRLDCKAPSMLALDILSSAADRFTTITDQQATAATKTVAKLGYQSTPSGAAALAALLLEKEPLKNPLIILSEGNVQN